MAGYLLILIKTFIGSINEVLQFLPKNYMYKEWCVFSLLSLKLVLDEEKVNFFLKQGLAM
jgi:hypothetical protein